MESMMHGWMTKKLSNMPCNIIRDYQVEAVSKMKNGCILNGTVGSGKSRTAVAYYYHLMGGDLYYYKRNSETGCYDVGPFIFDIFYPNDSFQKSSQKPIYTYLSSNIKDLYIITTAKKRDEDEWESDLNPFLFSSHRETMYYKHKLIVDSWQNIKKYKDIKNAFFIFDEQKLTGYGVWVESFLEISKNNQWILLSATPGDVWIDYLPVFIAHGWYKNKYDFIAKHVVRNPYVKYFSVQKYINQGHLIKLKNDILIDMNFKRETVTNDIDIEVNHDSSECTQLKKKKFDIFKNKPIKNASEYCAAMRRIVNTDNSRSIAILNIIDKHPKAIIFYNYDYELDILLNLFDKYPHAQWNGHKHEQLPTGEAWVYLVQYAAGCEAWNCITTDTMIFYSENYSFKIMEQAKGRINRMNTPYYDLYYYHLISKSDIDKSIRATLKRKKKFNEKRFAPSFDDLEQEKYVQMQLDLDI